MIPKTIVISFLTLFLFVSLGKAQFALWVTEKKVELHFDARNLDHEQLQEMVNHNPPVEYLLFDVRQPEEYAMSHIQGAIQLAPDITAEAFDERFATQIKNKTLIFYCSVGYRSSEVALRVQNVATKNKATEVYNLRGGIFRWYNEGNLVMDHQGPTDHIHPYDEKWGALIRQRKPQANPIK